MLKNARLLIIVLIPLFSCDRFENNKNDYIAEYQRLNYHNVSNLHKSIHDTINKWINDSVEYYTPIIYYGRWYVDSAICINSDSTKLATALLESNENLKSSEAESIEMLYGFKINGKWYFLGGESLYVPREFYQDSIYAPFTYSELSWVAHKEFLGAVILKNKDGSFSPNEKYFSYKFSQRNWGVISDITKDSFERYILHKVGQLYSRKNTKAELEEIKQHISQSKRPLESKGLWFRKLFSRKPFD